MNWSFRASDDRGMEMRASAMKGNEEELALFLEMRKRDKERDCLFIQSSDAGSSPIHDIAAVTPVPARKTASDEFLNLEIDKNDYEWLLSPPDTPLFPSLETGSQNTVMNQIGIPKAPPTALNSRLANAKVEPTARGNMESRQSSPGLNLSGGVRRLSSSAGPGSGSATPTRRPTLNSASKLMLTSAPKPSSTSTSKPSFSTTSNPSRSLTPTPRATSTKPTVPVRSSTPTTKFTARSSTPTPSPVARSSTPMTRGTARSSTPTARSTPISSTSTATSTARSSTPTASSSARSSTPTARSTTRSSALTARPFPVPAYKPTSRATTPIRRPTTLSTASDISSPPVKSPSMTPKVAPAMGRNFVPPRSISLTVKPRPLKPSEMPGFSVGAPPNLRTSISEKQISTTRRGPGAPNIRSTSVEPTPNGRIRRQSCSPSSGRPPNGININSGSSVPALGRAYAKANDNMSPVMYGTKMVERVINMRKLVPPRQIDKQSPRSNLSGKSSSPNDSGFGRTLSKKSLDMAIRHMDIRRSIPGNLRPSMTNIPASSMYSVRSGPAPRSRIVDVSDSSLAMSSNASSEVSVNNNALRLDRSQLEDDVNSEREVQSPASVQAR